MSQEIRYQAFISYAHADQAFARRLHGELERFRLPKDLSLAAAGGASPGSLGRFFRDDDELAAAPDLGEAIRSALAASQSLIVVCSPAAARSRWVAQEIAHFRDALGRNRIFAVICEGEPRAGGPDAAFPENLVAKGFEPLAADFRAAGREARRDALVRLVAGLCGADYDALKRRELSRARQAALRNGVLALAAFALAVVAGGASWLALRANERLGVALASETKARSAAEEAQDRAEKALQAERAARERAQIMGASSEAQFSALNENAIDFARSLMNWPSEFEGRATVLVNQNIDSGYDPQSSVSHVYWSRCPRTLSDCFTARPASVRKFEQSVIAQMGDDPSVRVDPGARAQFLRLCPSFAGPRANPIMRACAGQAFEDTITNDPKSVFSKASLLLGLDAQLGVALATVSSPGYCGSGGCSMPTWLWLRNRAGRYAPVEREDFGGDDFAIVFGPDGAFAEFIEVNSGQSGISHQLASVRRSRLAPAGAELTPFADFDFWEIYSEQSLRDRTIPPVLRVCPRMIQSTRGEDDPCSS